MAADVSFVLQMMMEKNGKDEALKKSGGGATLVTMDLLGGCSQMGSKELDLDLKVPFGWEKRLDMASGEVYLQRCTPVIVESNKVQHDLNLPAPAPAPASSSWRPDDPDSLPAGTLDLKLNLPTSPARSNLSVCTLEKVRSALERVERHRKRPEGSSSPASSSSAATSEKSSERKEEVAERQQPPSSSAMFAAGCPSCLLYVLISGRNPKCPRCDAVVPFPSASSSPSSATKRPKLDLNSSVI